MYTCLILVNVGAVKQPTEKTFRGLKLVHQRMANWGFRFIFAQKFGLVSEGAEVNTLFAELQICLSIRVKQFQRKI